MARKGKNKGGGGAQAPAANTETNVTPVDAAKVPEVQKPIEQPQKTVEPLKPVSDIPVEIPKSATIVDNVKGVETSEIPQDGTNKKNKKNKNKNQQPGENVPPKAQPPKVQQPNVPQPTESQPNAEVLNKEGEAAPGDTGTAKKKRNKKKKPAQQPGDQPSADCNAAPVLSAKPVAPKVDGEATLKKKKNKKDKKREAENKLAGEVKAAEHPIIIKEEPKAEIKVAEVKIESAKPTQNAPAIPVSPAVKNEEANKKDNKEQQEQVKIVDQKPAVSVKSAESPKPEKKTEQSQDNKKSGNDQKRERKESESNKKNKNEKKAEVKKEIKQEEKKMEPAKESELAKPEEPKKQEAPVVQQPDPEKPKSESPKSHEKKQSPKPDNKKKEEPKVVVPQPEKKVEAEKKLEPTPCEPKLIKCAMFGPSVSEEKPISPKEEKKPELKVDVKKPEENKPEVKKPEEKKQEVKKAEEKKPEEKKQEVKKSEEKKPEVKKPEEKKVEKQQQKTDKPEKSKSESPKAQEKKQSPKPEVKEAKKPEQPKVVSEKPVQLPTVEKVPEVEKKPTLIKFAMPGPEIVPTVSEINPSKVQEVTTPNVPDVKPISHPEIKSAPEVKPIVCPPVKSESIQESKPATIAEVMSKALPETKAEKPVEVIKSVEVKPVTPNKEMDKQLLNAALTELIDSVSKMNLSEPKPISAEVKPTTTDDKKNLQPQQQKQESNKRNKSKSPRPEPKQDSKGKGKNNNEKSKAMKTDADIPMDMSVISKTSIEDAVSAEKASETSKNSKNEQRSDFVPSVEQQPKQQTSAKSQGKDKNQSDKKNDSVKKAEPVPESVRQAQNVTPTSNKRSKDEANLKQTEAISELKTHELPEKTAQEKMDSVAVPVKLLDILDAKMTTPAESPAQCKAPTPLQNSPRKDEKKPDTGAKQKSPKEQQPKKQNKGPTDVKQNKTPPPGKKPDGKQQQQEKAANGSKNELIPKEIKLEDNLKVESLSEVKPLPSNPPSVLLESNTPKVEPEQKSVSASTSVPLKSQGIKPDIPPKPVALGIKKSPSPPVSSKQPKLPTPGTSSPKEVSPSKKCETQKKPEILPKPTNVPAPPTKRPPPPPVDEDEEYIEYKITPRPVFLPTICQICKTSLKQFTTCSLCQMVSYCSEQHMKDDLPTHKDLCSAIQDIAKKRGGHLYNSAKILNYEDFRSLRTHAMLVCQNVLKRQLQLFEREILLYPRICATNTCREWRPNLLVACPDCGQVSYCVHHPDHLPSTHLNWCKAYSLFQKLVLRQKNSGRIEPSLPSKIMQTEYNLPTTMDDTLKDLYKNYSILKDECSHAALSLVATAPLTALSAAQKCCIEIPEKFVIHLIGAELQFEADTLDKWEAFFLHLVPQLVELRIVFIGPELNAENLPLDVLSRIRMCRACRQSARAVKFDFQCGKLYHDYFKSSAFTKPDLVCFFNPGLYRPTGFNGLDTWPETIRATTTIGCPIVVTSYTEYESPMDLARLEKEAKKELKIIHPPNVNLFASQRPDRNFISDEIVPMIFKNYFLFIVK